MKLGLLKDCQDNISLTSYNRNPTELTLFPISYRLCIIKRKVRMIKRAPIKKEGSLSASDLEDLFCYFVDANCAFDLTFCSKVLQSSKRTYG